jgi:hypothetical protein
MARRPDHNHAIDALLAFNPDQLEARAQEAALEETAFEQLPVAAQRASAPAAVSLDWLWDFAVQEMTALQRRLTEESALRAEQAQQIAALQAQLAASAAVLRAAREDLAQERNARVAAEREAAGLLARRTDLALSSLEASQFVALQDALADEIEKRQALAAEARCQKALLTEMARRQQPAEQRPAGLLQSDWGGRDAGDADGRTERVQQLTRVLIAERRARFLADQQLRRVLRAQGIELP